MSHERGRGRGWAAQSSPHGRASRCGASAAVVCAGKPVRKCIHVLDPRGVSRFPGTGSGTARACTLRVVFMKCKAVEFYSRSSLEPLRHATGRQLRRARGRAGRAGSRWPRISSTGQAAGAAETRQIRTSRRRAAWCAWASPTQSCRPTVSATPSTTRSRSSPSTSRSRLQKPSFAP